MDRGRPKEDKTMYAVYETRNHGHGVRIETHSQNFEFSRYVDLIEATYTELCGVDHRFRKNLPYSLFLHSMNTVAWLKILETCYYNDSSLFSELEIFENPWNIMDHSEFLLPGPVYEYLSLIGNVKTDFSPDIIFNLPKVALPSRKLQIGDIHIRPGTFGKVTAENHNVYEAYMSPYITARRVEASLSIKRFQDAEDWEPLPEVLKPEGWVPTPNLLGYGPADFISRHRRQFFTVRFRNSDDLCSRIQYCPEIMQKVTASFWRLKKCFNLVNIGSTHIRSKNNLNCNLVFCMSTERETPKLKLSKSNCILYSHYGFSANTAAKAEMTAFHRKRVAAAHGACYLPQSGELPDDWLQHINDNFNMSGLFAPLSSLNSPHLSCLTMETFVGLGSRYDRLFITKNYVIMKLPVDSDDSSSSDDYYED